MQEHFRLLYQLSEIDHKVEPLEATIGESTGADEWETVQLSYKGASIEIFFTRNNLTSIF